MNLTTAEYFTFNINHSMLLVGKSGAGKSFLVHKLIERYEHALDPSEIQYAIFDMKQIEFILEQGDVKEPYLYFDIVTNPHTGLERLETLVNDVAKRITDNITKPLLFIYVEECDMAVLDQKRFDTALIYLNEQARQSNIKVIYSTSRPSLDTVSPELLQSFELILSGPVVRADAQHLGVPQLPEKDSFEFAVTDNRHL